MSEGPWQPRTGGGTSRSAPKAGPGADLAEVRRAHSARGTQERESTALERRREAARRHRELVRRADRAQRSRVLRDALSSRWLRWGLLLAAVIAAAVLFGIPQAKKLLHPKLTEQQLRVQLPVLNVEVTRLLNAKGVPAITDTADQASFQVTFSVPKGTENVVGRKVKADCSVTFLVDRDKSSAGQLSFQRTQLIPCKTKR